MMLPAPRPGRSRWNIYRVLIPLRFSEVTGGMNRTAACMSAFSRPVNLAVLYATVYIWPLSMNSAYESPRLILPLMFSVDVEIQKRMRTCLVLRKLLQKKESKENPSINLLSCSSYPIKRQYLNPCSLDNMTFEKKKKKKKRIYVI